MGKIDVVRDGILHYHTKMFFTEKLQITLSVLENSVRQDKCETFLEPEFDFIHP